MVIINKVTFYRKVKKLLISLPEFVYKGMQSFKKIYSEVMKLNRFFSLHFFAKGLYWFCCISSAGGVEGFCYTMCLNFSLHT